MLEAPQANSLILRQPAVKVTLFIWFIAVLILWLMLSGWAVTTALAKILYDLIEWREVILPLFSEPTLP